jgi:hypothetical protein
MPIDSELFRPVAGGDQNRCFWEAPRGKSRYLPELGHTTLRDTKGPEHRLTAITLIRPTDSYFFPAARPGGFSPAAAGEGSFLLIVNESIIYIVFTSGSAGAFGPAATDWPRHLGAALPIL